MELWGKRHAAHQQGSSHVGEAHHQFFSLLLYLNGQLPGGGQDESHRATQAVYWSLEKEGAQMDVASIGLFN